MFAISGGGQEGTALKVALEMGLGTCICPGAGIWSGRGWISVAGVKGTGDGGQRTEEEGQGGGAVLGHSKDWVLLPPGSYGAHLRALRPQGPGLMNFSTGHVAVVWGKESSQEAQGMVTCKGVRRAGKLGGR